MAQFTNQATLTYNGQTTTSNVTVGELLEVLSATKTALTDSYRPGDRITYVVSLVNSGTTAFTNLTLTDDLGAYTFGEQTLTPLDLVEDSVRYYVNGVLQAAPTVTAGPPAVFENLSVPAGGNIIVIYEAEVNGFAPGNAGGSITNTVTLSGGGISTPVTASETVEAGSEALLTISKAICPAVVAENGQITYTFIIQNVGNTAADAASDIVVTDTFDPILSNITVTLDGTALAAGTDYSYNTATGEFATNAGVITVPAASYTQDETTGEWTVNPGVAVLTVTGTV